MNIPAHLRTTSEMVKHRRHVTMERAEQLLKENARMPEWLNCGHTPGDTVRHAFVMLRALYNIHPINDWDWLDWYMAHLKRMAYGSKVVPMLKIVK